MEEELGLFEKEIDCVYYWERIRPHVVRELRRNKGFREKGSDDQESIRILLKKLYLAIRNIFLKNPFRASDSKYLFINRGRRKKIQGEWFDIFIDPLIERNDLEEYEYFEEAFREKTGHFNPSKTENTRYLDLLKYGGAILRRLGYSKNLSSSERQELSEIEAEIKGRFGVSAEVTSRVRFQLTQRKIFLPLYKRLFEKVDPDVIFLINHNNFAETEAAKELDIPVVEFQHGVIFEGHFAYHYPAINEREAFPDYLLTWGQYWTERCSFPFKEKNVVEIGHPYFEYRRQQLEHKGSRKQILIVSQGPYREYLKKAAIELDEELDEYRVVYKLHPMETGNWREEYADLIEKGIQIETGDEKTLYQLFAKSQIQVGVNSTALFEGVSFGLQTYILEKANTQFISDIVSEENFLTSAEDIADAIRSQKDSQKNNYDLDYVFKKDAAKNFSSFVERF